MSKPASVVNLDPIDRKKPLGLFGRFMITHSYKGTPMKKTDPFGHYLFVGAQRQGKTTSALWYLELLKNKYEKQGKKVILASNMGFGFELHKSNISQVIHSIEYNPDKVYIFMIDELQSWFPKDTKDTQTLKLIDQLTGDFSQLGKRQIYVLSTAQVYGRVNKNLREQCLYMVQCRPSFFRHKCVNDFILGDDVLCDDLGRWSGRPKRILIHGLPKTQFDTHRMIISD